MANMPNVNMTAAEVLAITPKPDSETQVSVITKAIMDAFTTLNPADDAVTDATNAATGLRERLMGELALLSAEEEFEADKIADAATAALTQWKGAHNLVPTSLAQFAVELRRAMHPSARDYVIEAIQDSREQWEQSSQAEGHPLRKAFAKRYHMVAGSKGVLQAHIDADKPAPKAGTPDKRIATDHGDASDPYAIAGAKQSADKADPKAAARVIAKLVKALQAIETEFPAPAIGQMISFAAALDATTLANAKNVKMAAMHRAAKAKPAPAVAPAKAKATESALDDLVSE
jgi:hypothetical protein